MKGDWFLALDTQHNAQHRRKQASERASVGRLVQATPIQKENTKKNARKKINPQKRARVDACMAHLDKVDTAFLAASSRSEAVMMVTPLVSRICLPC